MLKWLSLAIILSAILSVEARANTITAATCLVADVSAAISSAAAGDTVIVPSGNCSWSGLGLNKAITLQGAGVGKTNITLTGNNNLNKSAAGVTRVSGFSFSISGGGNANKGFTVGGSWRSAQPIVIENNSFTVSGSGLFVITVSGGVIIANNSFTGGWDDSFMQLKNNTDSDNSWGTADTLGSRDTTGTLNIYVETNTIYGGTNQGIDADDASRIVYRYNKVTYGDFNSHGYDTSPIGLRHFEVYNNNFVDPPTSAQIGNINQVVWLRGATGVIFNNYSDSIAGSFWGSKPNLRMNIRGGEDVRPQGTCAQVTYPVPRQLGQNFDGTKYFTDPIYIWGNTGTWNISAGWNWGNPCGLTWSTFFQWGRDGINNGTAKPGYTPYTYPHPLTKGSPALPAAPTGLQAIVN